MNGPVWLTSARSKLRVLRKRFDRIHIALALAVLIGLATMPFLSAWPLFIFDLLALILFVVALVMIITMSGLLALRPPKLAARYRQQPDHILWREGLAYYLWFALFHLAIIALLLGLSLAALWFDGPTSLTLALCCGLHASAALTAMGLVNKPRAGLRTLGLLWRGPMPQSPLAFPERLIAVLFLARRYAHGLVQDRQQDAPVLLEITRTLDSARVGVNTRAISLWRDGFARWKGELSGRLWACTSMSSSTAALALFLILILPQSQLYPNFLPGQPGRFALWSDLIPEKEASEAAKPEDQAPSDVSPAQPQDSAEDQTEATVDPETSESSADNQDQPTSADRAESNPRAPQNLDPSAPNNAPPLDPSANSDPSTDPHREPRQQDQPQSKTERHNGAPSQPGPEGRTGSESQAGSDPKHRSESQARADQKGSQPQSGADQQGRQPQARAGQNGNQPQFGAERRSGSQSQAGKDRQQGSQPQANAERQSGAPSQARGGQSQKPASGERTQSASSTTPGQKKGAASESNQEQPGQQAGNKGQARPFSSQSGAAQSPTAAQKTGQSPSNPSSQPGGAPPAGAAGTKPGATASAGASSQSASAQTTSGPPKPGSEGGGNKPGSGTSSGQSAEAASASSAAGQGQGQGKATAAQNGATRSSERQASQPHSPSSDPGEPQAIASHSGPKGTGQVPRNYPVHADSLLTVELPPMEETPNGLKSSQGEPLQTWDGKATSESDQQAPHQEQGKAKDPKPRVVTQRLPNWVVPLLPAKNQPPTPE